MGAPLWSCYLRRSSLSALAPQPPGCEFLTFYICTEASVFRVSGRMISVGGFDHRRRLPPSGHVRGSNCYNLLSSEFIVPLPFCITSGIARIFCRRTSLIGSTQRKFQPDDHTRPSLRSMTESRKTPTSAFGQLPRKMNPGVRQF